MCGTTGPCQMYSHLKSNKCQLKRKEIKINELKNELEHMNPHSFSWCLMRLSILKLAVQNITSLLNVVGIDMNGIVFIDFIR